jgi:LPPG:FO 2-phospho-L-lactate transferase
MSDDAIPTSVYTKDDGELAFQEYFVRRQCRPQVTGFRFNGIEQAHPAPGVLPAIQNADLVVICPSNPWVSVGPILAVPGIRQALENHKVVAVSPIIGGQAVKGPAAKMFIELGLQPTALAVARYYGDLLDGFVFDDVDRQQEEEIYKLGIAPLATDTLMKTLEDRRSLARRVLEFGMKL